VAALPAVPAQLVARDFRTETVTARRELTFAMGMGGPGGMSFTIDGKQFDPNRIDQAVQPGAVEEWTLINTTPDKATPRVLHTTELALHCGPREPRDLLMSTRRHN
jgi:FtsP/CotA-like multicopper oxidase with cupredoxin domain